jgi:hypothetical protein
MANSQARLWREAPRWLTHACGEVRGRPRAPRSGGVSRFRRYGLLLAPVTLLWLERCRPTTSPSPPAHSPSPAWRSVPGADSCGVQVIEGGDLGDVQSFGQDDHGCLRGSERDMRGPPWFEPGTDGLWDGCRGQ